MITHLLAPRFRCAIRRGVTASVVRVHVSHDLGMTAVSEGIETVVEVRALIDCECDLLQRYLITRPGPPRPTAYWPLRTGP